MARQRVLLVGTLLAAVALIIPTGCKPKPKIPKGQDYIGTWTEDRADDSLDRNPRIYRPPRPSEDTRQLIINEDGTFRMIAYANSPSEALSEVTGTWTADEYGSIRFEVQNNSFDKKRKDWATPQGAGSFGEAPDKATYRITVNHDDNGIAFYRRDKQ